MKSEEFKRIKEWKKKVVQYYRKYKKLDMNLCCQLWDTYSDMIKAMSFMKYELGIDKFTTREYEELINR